MDVIDSALLPPGFLERNDECFGFSISVVRKKMGNLAQILISGSILCLKARSTS